MDFQEISPNCKKLRKKIIIEYTSYVDINELAVMELTRQGKKNMTTISFINMKGGVGKTTSAVEIATILAKEHKKKVLLIDLDPQTNATLSLITLEAWEKIKDTATIADVLGMNRGMSSRDDEFDIKDAIIKDVGGIKNLDLIPSHLELTFLDLDLVSVPARESVLKKPNF